MRINILTLTIREAIEIASLHEDNLYWDLWDMDLFEVPNM